MMDVEQLNPENLSGLSAMFLEIRDYLTSKMIYERLVRDNPQNPEYHGKFAAILKELGEIDRAIEEVEIVIRLDPAAVPEAEPFLKELRRMRPGR